MFSMYTWHHNIEAIFIKISVNVRNEIMYKTYISNFSRFANKQNYADGNLFMERASYYATIKCILQFTELAGH